MQTWFEQTVRALAACLVPAELEPISAADIAEIAAFIRRQFGRMAAYLRWPIALLTLAFHVNPLARGHLCCFHHLMPDDARRQVARWRSSRFKFRRDLVRFYESLVIFALFSLREDEPDA